MKQIAFAVQILALLVCLADPAGAVLPLITDDSGTQGRGKWLIELSTELSESKNTDLNSLGLETTRRDKGVAVRTALTYGLREDLDLAVGLPYQWKHQEVGEVSIREKGISDLFLEAKWRFFEMDGLGLALKPGVTLPTGNEEKDLGAGRPGYYLLLIATKEKEPFAVHANVGYKRNENKLNERENIWHASLAGELKLANKLSLVLDVGIETNPDRGSVTSPAYLLGGFIYSVTDNLDLDFGLKAGLNRAEADWTLLFGLSLRL